MNKAILIVDDSASMRAVTKMALAHLGVPLLEAADGAEALAKMQLTPTGLVISDINMPGMDGLEMLRQMKADPRLKFIPVIMLTTEGCQAQIEKGRAFGAKAWIVKPFKSDALTAAVQKILAV